MPSLEEKEFSEKIDVSIWKRILAHLKPYKSLVILLIVVTGFVSVLDLAYPQLNRYAINKIIATDSPEKLFPFFLVFLVASLLQGGFVAMYLYLAGRIEAYTASDMRREAFKHTHDLTFAFHDKTPVGYLMARLTGDISRLSETIGWAFVDIVWSLGIIIAVTIAMLWMNWKLALLVMAVIPPLAILMLFFQRKILKQQRKARRINSQITRSQNESIVGARTTKTLVREELNYEEFSQLTSSMRKASIRSHAMGAIFWPIVMTLGSVATGVALWRGGIMTMEQAIDFGTLTAFISYAGQFFDPITNLARTFVELQSSQASAERVVQLLDTPIAIQEKEGVEEQYGTAFAPKRENWPSVKGDVTFEHVNFHYTIGEEVLHDFSLEVKAGQTVALVGETGSGKSTIVNLLCRFYEPVEGQIYIDGVEYRERSQHWLQSNIGFVLQTPHLFSGTIRDNIRYGNPEASDEQVRWAAELVNAEEFIQQTEHGYDTQVGEGGSRLSTGEKQLVSFARAVLTDPRLFVLDEATSSVDTETEQIIQNAITQVLEGRTSFIIAHRLSTIRQADIILVIRGGRIVEQGNHASLMEERGYYYNLYTNQFREEQSHHAMKGKKL